MVDWNSLDQNERYDLMDYIFIYMHHSEVMSYLEEHMDKSDFENMYSQNQDISHKSTDWEERQRNSGKYLFDVLSKTVKTNPPLLIVDRIEGRRIITRIFSGTPRTVIPAKAPILGSGAIRKKDNYEELIIEDGIERIETAFAWANENLKYVYIPKSVSVIEGKAFLDCAQLGNVHIANDYCIVDKEAFAGCPYIR